MLQRAASNAYSWWWASHIRTKQSKWLEQSLQDMEDKTQNMLKLIEEDGDSFAKRAEMYYKRRPELISSVEEAYKVFRALADRYDLLSKDLQNANQKIATVFPDQVPYELDDDDEGPPPKPPKNPQIPTINTGNVPKVPKAPIKDLKGLIATASKQFQSKKPAQKSQTKNKVVEKSGLTKDQALDEIDNLQKNILALQTVKEFVKGSYESGLEKYWSIENQIMEMQQKVCRLQDEFTVDRVIEDDEARTLMAEAALKSCRETLALLEEKQEQSTRDAREEYKKIESARRRLNSFKHEYLKNQIVEENSSQEAKIGKESQGSNIHVCDLVQETNENENQHDKTKGKMELSPKSTLTVTQLAEKIDELVTKVISLETAVSSQTVLITTLRTEADNLHEQIRKLEDEKETLIDDTQSLSARVKELEDKMKKIHDLNKNVESQNSNLQSNFAEARSSLGHLSEKLSSVKPDEDVEETDSSSSTLDEAMSPYEVKTPERIKEEKDKSSQGSKTEDRVEDVKEVGVDVQSSEASSAPTQESKTTEKKTVTFLDPKLKEGSDAPPASAQAQDGETEKEGELNWQQMLLSGMEDKEKILLKEYTTILRNYKDVKKKLSDMEKKDRDSQFDITLQMREMKKAVLKRDEEIQYLRQKLNGVQGNEAVKEENHFVGDGGENPEAGIHDLERSEAFDVPISNKEDEIKLVFLHKTPSVSVVEEKLRMDIDAILDENLDFWLRFSTSFHQIQKFKTETQDLQDEISKLKEKKQQEGSATADIKSEVRPIYKHLREIQTELTVWLEQSTKLKDELKRRFTSLCTIQEEITEALKEGVEEDEIRFSSHQAAKFQGEISNMKQENNKVREELQSGLDRVSLLQLEIEKTLRNLNEEFGISSDQPQNTITRSKIPLRSFIFGTKPKKKNSIFSCMHPNRRYGVLRSSHVPVSSTHH